MSSDSTVFELEDTWLKGFTDGLRPDPKLTVSEWSDQYRFLARAASNEAGRWRTDRVPYMREIMDCLSEQSPHEMVVVMKCAQAAVSESMNNWLLYIAHTAPAPTMMVQPTLDVAKKYSKKRLQPAIRETPVVRELIRESRSRESDNTIVYKEFPGGSWTITGANSPSALASDPIKFIAADEVDRWPVEVGSEGGPFEVVSARTTTFGSEAKVFVGSTPTDMDFSLIESMFKESDQRYWYVPCPHCKEMQRLVWGQLKFERNDSGQVLRESIAYECVLCCERIPERYKTWMGAHGEWRAHNPTSETPGFHINGLMRPLGWRGWFDMAKQWVKAGKDPVKLKPFVNLQLGEVWEEKGEKIEDGSLLIRCVEYEAEVPFEVGVLTAAVDVQDDRFEFAVKGWGRGEESWLIDYGVIVGDPAKTDDWGPIDDLLNREFQHESGQKMTIATLAVDTAGHHTMSAYDYCGEMWRRKRRVLAIHGLSEKNKPVTSPPTRSNTKKVPLYGIGTDTAKDAIFARMKLTEKGPGYMHYPRKPGIDEEYFKGLTSEKAVRRIVNGLLVRKYVKVRSRNEPLDLEVYNLAAMKILRPNLDSLCDRLAAISRRANSDAPEDNPPPPYNPRERQYVLRPRKRGGFVNRWKG